MKRISCYFKKKSLLHRLLHLGLGVLLTISLFPIPIHAQALASPFLGINFQVTAYGENMSSIVLPKINIDSINSTVPSGYISGQLNCTSPSTPTSSNPCDVYSFQNTSGQSGTGNGTRIYLNLQNYLLEANGNATINHQSYFFIDYEFILDDNYKGYVTITDADSNTRTIYVNGNEFHYQRMQLDLTEKAITIDEYQLVRVVEPIMWDIPIESYTSVNYVIQQSGSTIIDWIENNYFKYPIVQVDNTVSLFSIYGNTGDQLIIIMGCRPDIYGGSLFKNYFDLYGSVDGLISTPSISEFQIINRTNYINNSVSNIIKFTLTYNKNQSYYFKPKDTENIIPIYFNFKSNKYVSSEFGELYDLLGHQESSSELDNTNTQFQTDANSLISIEDSFNSTMNSNLDNINPTFNMGSSFLASANWVSTQFNRIVNNTPFASLITFGLTLGLGLLIIGKIRK